MVELVGSNKRVLDVGCDTGYLGEQLIALGNRVSGVEYNPVSAAAAADRLDRVVVADLETADLVAEFGPGSFDVVVYGDVLEHLRDPLPVLRQGRRLLAPGGSVVISTPNIAHGDIRLALLSGRFTYTKLGILDETHTRFFTRDSLVTFLADAGLVLVDLRRTRAPLFSTEQGLVREDHPSELVARLEDDIEATTYQFVVRAAPEDAATQATARALELDRVTQELARTGAALATREAELAGVVEALAARDTAVAEAQAEVTALRAERERTGAELAAQRAEVTRLASHVAALEATKAVRAARRVRRVLPRRPSTSG
jgi:2-polyprenyl-3-methyl-5-hydroxy-6-metoxy-1,4-benzoquinol methylase